MPNKYGRAVRWECLHTVCTVRMYTCLFFDFLDRCSSDFDFTLVGCVVGDWRKCHVKECEVFRMIGSQESCKQSAHANQAWKEAVNGHWHPYWWVYCWGLEEVICDLLYITVGHQKDMQEKEGEVRGPRLPRCGAPARHCCRDAGKHITPGAVLMDIRIVRLPLWRKKEPKQKWLLPACNQMIPVEP